MFHPNGYDVMEVCLNGHFITDFAESNLRALIEEYGED